MNLIIISIYSSQHNCDPELCAHIPVCTNSHTQTHTSAVQQNVRTQAHLRNLSLHNKFVCGYKDQYFWLVDDNSHFVNMRSPGCATTAPECRANNGTICSSMSGEE